MQHAQVDCLPTYVETNLGKDDHLRLQWCELIDLHWVPAIEWLEIKDQHCHVTEGEVPVTLGLVSALGSQPIVS